MSLFIYRDSEKSGTSGTLRGDFPEAADAVERESVLARKQKWNGIFSNRSRRPMNTRNVCSTFQSQKWNKKWNKPLLPRRTSFSASRCGGGGNFFFGLFPLVYERKTLEMSLWPAETRTLPLRTFRFRGMIIVHRFSGSAPVPP